MDPGQGNIFLILYKNVHLFLSTLKIRHIFNFKIHTLIFTSLKARYDENQEKFETTVSMNSKEIFKKKS